MPFLRSLTVHEDVCTLYTSVYLGLTSAAYTGDEYYKTLDSFSTAMTLYEHDDAENHIEN